MMQKYEFLERFGLGTIADRKNFFQQFPTYCLALEDCDISERKMFVIFLGTWCDTKFQERFSLGTTDVFFSLILNAFCNTVSDQRRHIFRSFSSLFFWDSSYP